MTTDTRACKNCTSYSDRGQCAKGTTFLTNQITKEGERIATFPYWNSVCAQHEMRKGLPKAFYVRPTTCGNCFYFSAEPREIEAFDSDEVEVCPAGCEFGNEVRSSEAESYRPVQSSDRACEEHETEIEVNIRYTILPEGRELLARDKSEFNAARRRERYTVIYGGRL